MFIPTRKNPTGQKKCKDSLCAIVRQFHILLPKWQRYPPPQAAPVPVTTPIRIQTSEDSDGRFLIFNFKKYFYVKTIYYIHNSYFTIKMYFF